ncbi:hypothetical protein [Streptomyces sp. MUM 16J]|uniref:DUF6907 domain-containing protein n=1 Tax=Streptomyces sp. MUM 16J TaxID=2791988 RepID=UPI001F03C566|nr:hypothetical protein [Streptomyces sp. MUM 16J]MCH0555795.1 hypothetical protein [Streptomyces sp. MUM 16J]
MSTEPRNAIVNVLVTKALEIPEPDWCAGHHTDQAQFKPDITHYGPEHAVEINGFRVLQAMLSQSPYAEYASPDTVLYVESGDFTGSYSPDEVFQLADALATAAEQLRTLGLDLASILAGGAL